MHVALELEGVGFGGAEGAGGTASRALSVARFSGVELDGGGAGVAPGNIKQQNSETQERKVEDQPMQRQGQL